MASNASVDDLQQAIEDRLNVQNERLINTLRACESARYHPDLGPAEGLQLVQDLYKFADEFKLFRLSGKEKK